MPAPGLAGGAAADIVATAVRGAGGELDHFGFRWIAQALVGATLVGHPQLGGRLARRVQRQVDVGYAVIHLDIAEVFVGLGLAGGQHRLAQAAVGGFGAELEAMAVEVIALGVGETQFHQAGRAFYQTEAEGLAHGQEIGAVIEGSAQGRVRAVIQQPCGDGQGHQQQDQAQQAAHGGLLNRKCLHHNGPRCLPAGSGL
ncbi:hypothetical protein D9M68_671540 [compost metagenome]